MSTEAINNIKGYCTEVNQPHWEELVGVADEVGVPVSYTSRQVRMVKPDKYARLNAFGKLGVYYDRHRTTEVIPFHDFIAKLRGVEEWTPKAGEMVEVKDGPHSLWYSAEFVGKIDGWNVCRLDCNKYSDFIDEHIRPITPNITRAEAEAKLKTLGVNVRITD